MTIRSALAIPGLIALAATPFAAQADGSGRATDACIAAFVETYVPEGRTVRVHKSELAPGPLGYFIKRVVAVTLSCWIVRFPRLMSPGRT